MRELAPPRGQRESGGGIHATQGGTALSRIPVGIFLQSCSSTEERQPPSGPVGGGAGRQARRPVGRRALHKHGLDFRLLHNPSSEQNRWGTEEREGREERERAITLR